MFEDLAFEQVKTSHPIISRISTLNQGDEFYYNRAAVKGANYRISGKVDTFVRPVITDYAREKLFYMEAFNRFYYEKGSFTERQDFQSYLIAYTYSGEGSLKYGGREYTLREGDGFFINCRNYHYYSAISEVWDVGILHLNGPLLADLSQQYMMHTSPVFHEPLTGQTQEFIEKLLHLYSSLIPDRDWHISNCLDSLVCHLLELQSRKETGSFSIPEDFQYLIKYMESNYTRSMSLDYLADFIGMSKYAFSRSFRKYTGFSPIDYLITLRIERAKVLLKNSSMSAAEIAEEVGIHDVNNFTNLFRKKTGFTPGVYRKEGLSF